MNWNHKKERNGKMVFFFFFLCMIMSGSGISTVLANGTVPTTGEVPRNLAMNAAYTVSQPANASYADEGGKQLTDGVYAADDFLDPAWVGHNGDIDREVIIDLGASKSISAIKTNFLNDGNVGISVPDAVTFSVSQDGVQWSKVVTVAKSRVNGIIFTSSYEWDGNRDGFPKHQPKGKMAYARYVKLHAVVDYWLFLDEIEVWGFDNKQDKAVELIPDPEKEPSYLMAGEQTGYMNDLVLFYNGQYPNDAGNWTAGQFIPYAAYVDEELVPQDWMFDSGLFLAIRAASGRTFAEGDNPSNKEDWDWYINKTLTGDAVQLNEAVKQVAAQLGEPDHKMKIAIMVPMPDRKQTAFGDVDGDGIVENLSIPSDQEKVLRWYLHEVTQRWKHAGFTNLELTGFYWMSETITELEAMKYTADRVQRNHKLKFYWIPYYNASLYWKWETFGFDAMAYQPNHYFAGTTSQRISDAAARAKKIGSGIEIEFDDGVFNYGPGRQKLIDYLQGAMEYGYDGDVFRAYYQDLRTLYKAALSDKKEDRQIYEWIYSLIKGQPIDFTDPNPRNLALHAPYTVSLPPSSSYPDTNGTELTDGVYGNASNFYDAAWQGHSGSFDRSIVVDLQEPKSITSIKANFMEDRGPGIYGPDEVRISVSLDGQNWARVANAAKPSGSGVRTVPYVWDGAVDGLPAHQPPGEMIYARYVKIYFVLNVWGFIDEIEVRGKDGRVEGAVELTADEVPQTEEFLQAGEATGGINDLVLFYNGQYANNLGDWNASQFAPYVAYVDSEGQPVEWMFDGGLFLGLSSAYGRSFVETSWQPSSKKEDWEWYLDKTFNASNGDAAQLNEAVRQAGIALQDPNHKMKVVVMVPLPSTTVTDFGDVDGDGISENFNDPDLGQVNKEKAVNWYIESLLTTWNAANYSNLELVGFYWMHEAANPEDQAVIRYTSDLVHSHGKKFFWIPYYNAASYYKWKDLGFDAMAQQPNHYFTSGTGYERITAAAQIAKKFGAGLEIEFDDGVFTNAALRQKFIDYLKGAEEYGYEGDVFRAYYQDIRTLLKAAASDHERDRRVYEWIHDLVKGNPLDLSDPIPEEPYPNIALGAAYTVSLPPEPQYPDTNGTELTDGVYAGSAFWDSGWQGHAYNNERDFIIDLGDMKSIAKIRANFLNDSGSGINGPASVAISVSSDGVSWAHVADVAKPTSQNGPVLYEWDISQQGLPSHQPQGDFIYAQYVKLHITLNVWAFIDEIEVRGAEGHMDNAVELTPDP